MITPDWDEFHSILLKNNIPQNQHHYYVKWIENFLLFFQTLNASTNDSLSILVSSIEAKHINHFLQDNTFAKKSLNISMNFPNFCGLKNFIAH